MEKDLIAARGQVKAEAALERCWGVQELPSSKGAGRSRLQWSRML
jgi:hypothetical protein